jgi:hypothetical protein
MDTACTVFLVGTADAHAFYEKSGYTFTGRRYKKTVGSSA